MRIQSVVLLGLCLAFAGCGPSKQEVQNIATASCNKMSSQGHPVLNRIMEVNKVRGEIGEEPYSGTHNEILSAIGWGICNELVLNDPDYEQITSELVEIERQFVPVLRIIRSLIHEETAESFAQEQEEVERVTEQYQEQIERLRAEAGGVSVETEIESLVAELNAEVTRIRRERHNETIRVITQYRSEHERISALYDAEVENFLSQL